MHASSKSAFGSKRRGLAAEALFALAGVIALEYCALAGLQVSAARRAAEKVTVAAPMEGAAAGVQSPTGVIGTIRIPALKLSAPITNGIEPIALIRGVGHIPGTAVPGGLGTMGLAGHRDTFFRSLRKAKPGMDIRVSDATGSYRYLVDSTEIVFPEQVNVLDIGSRPELVLVTCFPFDYIGAAPKRFIVHAHLLSVLSDDSRSTTYP